MMDTSPHGEDKLGLLQSLGRLFRHEQEETESPEGPTTDFARLEEEFEAAICALNKRVEQQRHTVRRTGSQGMSPQELAEERRRRKEAAHRAMREDIESMHVQLRTGFAGADLDEIVAFLTELDTSSREGRDSFALLPRARYAITQRLRAEAGGLAVERLVSRLQRKNLAWPDPTHHPPSATPEEIDVSRRRRLSDVRGAFLAYSLERIAERVQGIVWGWGGDYPDRGSLLWRESVLVGVGAAIWGKLLQHFVELLRQDADLLLARTEETLGEELAVLRAALDSSSTSAEEATQAVASSLRVLDEVVPEIGWQLVRSRLPQARSDSSNGF